MIKERPVFYFLNACSDFGENVVASGKVLFLAIKLDNFSHLQINVLN